MATEKELQQENEKLTARLKKAVDVFNDQKATIARQAEEIESLKQKAAEGEKKDNEFFDQVNEIETLKANLASVTSERDEANERLKKSAVEFKKMKTELADVTEKYNDTKNSYEKLNKHLNNIRDLINKGTEE